MFNVDAWPIGSQFSKYGDSELKLNTSAKIINSSTYVPLRFTSEALNMNVERDTVIKIVIINNKDKSPAEYIKGEDSRVELAKAGDVTILASKQADGNMFTKTTVRTKNGGFYNA